MPIIRTDRKVVWRALAVGAAVIVLIVLLALLGRAKVTGATAAERIESVREIVAESPYGAASALTGAARGDPSAEVRAAALHGLARLGKVSEKTFRAAATDGHATVRTAATDALATIAKPWAVDLLGAMAVGDADDGVRRAAVGALGRCPADEAVVALVGLLDGADAPDDARAAAEGLWKRCRIGAPPPQAGNGPAWERAVTRIKADKVVRDAYAALGKEPPSYRPELLPQLDRMGE